MDTRRPGDRRRLAHRWQLNADAEVLETLISGYIRPSVRSVPPAMARQLGPCRISVVDNLAGATVASEWAATERGLEISVAAAGLKEHDVALELLLCLGQALWTKLRHTQRKAYWLLLDSEISAGISGEIDEDALEQKRQLMSDRHSAGSRRRLDLYGAASFAGTAAEYIHCLWHDVAIRSGQDFLPARQLKRRLDLLYGWFPPGSGHRLFPPASHGGRR